MPALASPIPTSGQLVYVRTRNWLVEEAAPSPYGSWLRLACVDDDAQGDALEVIWEAELDGHALDAEAWEAIGSKGFDDPRLFAAYFNTLRWHCVTATDPKLFQAPFRAGIRVEAYQLEPLRKALQLPRVNLFIADDVGLGKTIEAGLIATELLLRRRVREVVVVCPPSMLNQWQDELDARFGLRFEILDRNYVDRIRRDRGYAVNPWDTFPRFLVSHRLLIDETYASPIRVWLDNLRPGTLLILDEAHHAAPASGSKYAIDSKFTRAIRDLAPRFEHLLVLSAPPQHRHTTSDWRRMLTWESELSANRRSRPTSRQCIWAKPLPHSGQMSTILSVDSAWSLLGITPEPWMARARSAWLRPPNPLHNTTHPRIQRNQSYNNQTLD